MIDQLSWKLLASFVLGHLTGHFSYHFSNCHVKCRRECSTCFPRYLLYLSAILLHFVIFFVIPTHDLVMFRMLVFCMQVAQEDTMISLIFSRFLGASYVGCLLVAFHRFEYYFLALYQNILGLVQNPLLL